MIEEQKAFIEKKVQVAAVCDCCGKRVELLHDKCGNIEIVPTGWHHFDAYHAEWGNDSGESYEEYDACSVECYAKLLSQVFEEFKEYETSKISGFKLPFVEKMLEALGRSNEQ